jgi:hypothetical protein
MKWNKRSRRGIFEFIIETGTEKQIDNLADFWEDKLDLIEGQASIPASIFDEK